MLQQFIMKIQNIPVAAVWMFPENLADFAAVYLNKRWIFFAGTFLFIVCPTNLFWKIFLSMKGHSQLLHVVAKWTTIQKLSYTDQIKNREPFQKNSRFKYNQVRTRK